MEGLVVLFLLVPILLIGFLLFDPFKKQREAKANREWDKWVKPFKNKELPNDYLAGIKDSSRNGKRGGRYETRISKKTVRPYRHYY